MKPILLLFAIALIHTYTLGQRKMTRMEILKNWKLSSRQHEDPSKLIINTDSTLNEHLIKFVDSLESIQIDSVIIFSTALPGYFSKSRCDTGIFPITSFIIWTKDKLSHIKKIRGKCLTEIKQDSLTYLFSFYGNHYQKIDSDFVMPIIQSATMNKDKTISYISSWIDHEPNYSFYYKIGKHHWSYHFCESYIEDKTSLFHDYNLNLQAYQWWKMVKREIDKLKE